MSSYLFDSETDEAEKDEDARLWFSFAGDKPVISRDILIQHYKPFSRSLAAAIYRKRAVGEMPLEDCLQYGLIGLIEAIDNYRLDGGASFRTYASYRIKGAVHKGINHFTERLQQREFYRLREQERILSITDNALHKDHTDTEQMNFDRLLHTTLDMAAIFMLDYVPDETPYQAYNDQELAYIGSRLIDLIERLPGDEGIVMRSHYLEDKLFTEIAQQLGISKARVSQLHASAIARLRRLYRDSAGLDKRY